MLVDVIVKANRILALLGTVFRAHVDLANNTIGDNLYTTALIDVTNQSLALGTYTLSLHSLVRDREEVEFKEGLKSALRFIERFKEVQTEDHAPVEVRHAVHELDSLIRELQGTVMVI